MEHPDRGHNTNWSFTRLSPQGEGGIGIFYLSGPDVEHVLQEVFSPASGERGPFDQELHYGWLTDGGETVDEVVVRFVDAEKSLSGEPAVELNTHSGPAILKRISSLLNDLGGTELDADEFLHRAEQNGALDALQRQAHESLLEVDTRRGAAVISNQLRGALSRCVENICNQLTNDTSNKDIRESILDRLKELIRLGKSGVAFTDPRDLCILGPPNVGKSTLMNTLSQRKTSIVHEESGTTRDVVHDTVVAWGYPFRVRDTAGLRASADRIEREGIGKARTMAKEADLVLWLGETVEEAMGGPDFLDADTVISIRNKEDLEPDPSYGAFVEDETTILRISAEEEEGIQSLRTHIVQHLGLDEDLPVDAAVPFREEQIDALEQARASLERGDVPKAARRLSAFLPSVVVNE